MSAHQSERASQVAAGYIAERRPVTIGQARDDEWIARDHFQIEAQFWMGGAQYLYDGQPHLVPRDNGLRQLEGPPGPLFELAVFLRFLERLVASPAEHDRPHHRSAAFAGAAQLVRKPLGVTLVPRHPDRAFQVHAIL